MSEHVWTCPDTVDTGAFPYTSSTRSRIGARHPPPPVAWTRASDL